VTMSNYNVTSVYLSTDGGFTYESVEGNLGDMGDIPGPAITSSSILPLGLVTGQDQCVDGVTSPTIPAGLTVYLVGTTTGLYSTLLMQGSHTIWERESARLMGNVLVFDIKTRYSDNYAAAATFGRGVFITKGEVDLSNVDDNISQNQLTLNSIYPNPAKDYVNVEFNNPYARKLTYGLYDMNGKIVRDFRAISGLPSNQSLRIETGELKSGVYLLELSDGTHKTTAKIVVSN
ncbi:MAG: T9SS type A sorting domain-containing protein, partial [Chlorobi bacterium]|nr:T9SS type A sorting domain-containing protein [Chlorobiota bacterium]